MQEQAEMVNQLNDFLRRRGLRANFLAKEVGISTAVLYNFKAGKRLLTHRQLEKLRSYISDYDQRLGDGVFGEGEKAGKTTV